MSGTAKPRPRVGISACLLGQEVRYDGSHKRDRYSAETLAAHFEWVPYCPEVAIGLGIPRPTIRLTGTAGATRVRGVKDDTLDVTGELQAFASKTAASEPRLCGYLLKKGSPSCGMTRVKVWGEHGQPAGSAPGKYAEQFMAAHPLIPYEEEGRLNDAPLRESFVERIYVMHRWRALVDTGLTAGKLVDFHTRHKYLLLSHAEVEYRALGRLVSTVGKADLPLFAAEYIATLMHGMQRRATRRRHANVLQHLLGFLRRTLAPGDRAELAAMIDEYRSGAIPLVVPIRFLKHHFARHPDDFVSMQIYLDPYPAELGLRNHL